MEQQLAIQSAGTLIPVKVEPLSTATLPVGSRIAPARPQARRRDRCRKKKPRDGNAGLEKFL
jgi:hypothetical protein